MSVATQVDLLVEKVDGRREAFFPSKIINVIRSAARAHQIEVSRPAEAIAARVAEALGSGAVTSEKIMRELLTQVADEGALAEALADFSSQKEAEIADATDVRSRIGDGDSEKIRNENGNKDSRTFIVQRDILAGSVTKALGLKKFPESVRRAHIKGLIHIHDLDRSPLQAMPNCSLPDFEYLLSHGFTLGNARIESPRSIGVAATLLVQLLGAISGEQYGGISVHEIDRLLEPYAQMNLEKNRELFQEVTNDFEDAARKKTVKDIYDAMQAFEYQVNTLTTSAAQTPFVSISMGQTTSWLGREIQKAILAVREKGMSGETAIFPKILFFVDEGINANPSAPNYDLKQAAMRCSMKRIYPDMVSAPRIRELKSGQLITPMGCRSFLHPWNDTIVGRNNLGVVSLNLPHLAAQAEGDHSAFFSLLDASLTLAFTALKVREDTVLSADLQAAPIMYTQGGLGDPTGKTTARDWYTGSREKAASISLGYVGLHNAMVALTGEEEWHDQPEAKALSHNILEHMNTRVDEVQDQFHAMVSVYSTPSESLADRFDEIDRTRFALNTRGYYENSFHFPSYIDTNPFAKIEFEAPYAPQTPGGFMYYVEAPNLNVNPHAFEAIWDEAYDKVGYFGINSPVDYCFDCGFEGEFSCDSQGYQCPTCGNRDESRASVTRRLCGYLGSPMKRPVVAGKQEEIASRVKHL